ncbi:MAG: 50S ribosomal protein L13 [Kiritimatiellia bacterium]|nr:50S ribosomal protein L13 [Lentisphaerota bacterium]
MKTTVPKENDLKREWHLVDATDQPLGRLAVSLANVIRGKNKPIFTPHVDTGDHVVVINARRVKLTGRKEENKVYQDYSGYRGGLKLTKAGDLRAKNPERMIYDAVRRMLPKNRLMRGSFKRLMVYPDGTHPHTAQAPKPLDV